mmetsp:Transcript_59143/g.105126  ORF Transcript_59143/g.105126 Transcript_59143/m.105126 type:complete len:282 (+) Transcript_59143:106-951(+)
MSNSKEGDEELLDEAWNSGEDTTGDPLQASVMADEVAFRVADYDELDVPEASVSDSPFSQIDSSGEQRGAADQISPIGRTVPFTRPKPPPLPRDPDLGPACAAQARVRRGMPQEQHAELGTGDPDSRASSPPLTREIRAGSPWSDPPGTMDPILEEDDRQGGNLGLRPLYMTEFMNSLHALSSSSSQSQVSRYTGTPAQASHENGSLADPSQGSSPPTSGTSTPSGGFTSKASMPRHVACIRKQILASRRLEELDLCTLSGSARRSHSQRSVSSRRSSTAE